MNLLRGDFNKIWLFMVKELFLTVEAAHTTLIRLLGATQDAIVVAIVETMV